MAVDGAGNIYVTGYSSATNNTYDYLTIAYSSAGTLLWANAYGQLAAGTDQACSLALGGNTNVYVTGFTTGSISGRDYATIAYSTTGLPLWTNLYNGPTNGDDQAYALAADAYGNVYVTGASLGVGSGQDFATIAYSSSGLPLWTNRYNGPGNSNAVPCAITVDNSGVVLVTGTAGNVGGRQDFATIAYSTAGLPLWTNLYHGPSTKAIHAGALARDDGSLYVAGPGGTSLLSTLGAYAFVKYVPDGVRLRVRRTTAASPSTVTLLSPPNINYSLQASTNLKDWQTLTNYPPLPVTTLQYTDGAATAFPTRFYRAVTPPH